MILLLRAPAPAPRPPTRPRPSPPGQGDSASCGRGEWGRRECVRVHNVQHAYARARAHAHAHADRAGVICGHLQPLAFAANMGAGGLNGRRGGVWGRGGPGAEVLGLGGDAGEGQAARAPIVVAEDHVRVQPVPDLRPTAQRRPVKSSETPPLRDALPSNAGEEPPSPPPPRHTCRPSTLPPSTRPHSTLHHHDHEHRRPPLLQLPSRESRKAVRWRRCVRQREGPCGDRGGRGGG